jgi:hypothetical protein
VPLTLLVLPKVFCPSTPCRPLRLLPQVPDSLYLSLGAYNSLYFLAHYYLHFPPLDCHTIHSASIHSVNLLLNLFIVGYRKAADFCKLILYPASLLKVFMVSRRFFWFCFFPFIPYMLTTLLSAWGRREKIPHKDPPCHCLNPTSHSIFARASQGQPQSPP